MNHCFSTHGANTIIRKVKERYDFSLYHTIIIMHRSQSGGEAVMMTAIMAVGISMNASGGHQSSLEIVRKHPSHIPLWS